eukprot:99934_1
MSDYFNDTLSLLIEHDYMECYSGIYVNQITHFSCFSTREPTHNPTIGPTTNPTLFPTLFPTTDPTNDPTDRASKFSTVYLATQLYTSSIYLTMAEVDKSQ